MKQGNVVKNSNPQLLKLLSTAVENTASTVVITNEKGIIEFVNPAFAKISGYTAEEAIGKRPSVLKSDYHSISYYGDLWRTILSGNVWKGEFYNRRKDGAYYWESAIITPIVDKESGVITHFVAIKDDITKTKYYLDQLQESERKLAELNATKDKFFSIIGHDLRNPISAVFAMSELLSEILESDSDSYSYALAIQESIERIDHLLKSLLLWAQTQTDNIKLVQSAINVSKLANDTLLTLGPAANTKGIRLHWTVEDDLTINADSNMVSFILRNLVSNAIKFTNSSGEVSVSIFRDDKMVRFVVSDTGIGINEKQLEKLFRDCLNFIF